MEFLWLAFQFGIAWFVGNFVSGSITQLGCCAFCSFPLIKRLKSSADCIDVHGLKSLFGGTVILHTIILVVASTLVIAFAPKMMQYGFFFSFVFTILIGAHRWGMTEENFQDFIRVAAKYALPDKIDEATVAIAHAIDESLS